GAMSEMEVQVVHRTDERSRRGPSWGPRWRAMTSMGGLVVRRRAWRDRGLLLVTLALVTASTLLSVVAPRLVLDVVDRGAADVLARAEDRSQLVLRASVGNSGSPNPGLQGELFGQFLEAAEEVRENLPP